MIGYRRFVRDTWLIFARTAREAAGNVGLAFVAPILLSLFLLVLFHAVYGRIAEVPGWPTAQFIDGWRRRSIPVRLRRRRLHRRRSAA